MSANRKEKKSLSYAAAKTYLQRTHCSHVNKSVSSLLQKCKRDDALRPESVGFDWRCWNYQEHIVVPKRRAIISKMFLLLLVNKYYY